MVSFGNGIPRNYGNGILKAVFGLLYFEFIYYFIV